ncbi:MAG: beta-galactosidase, partial [Acidobacteria bacterium]|nr:beta-galactosidase [Acidobacteriota bacterium]
MQRRAMLKIIPFSFAGLTRLLRAAQNPATAAGPGNRSTVAEVKLDRGTPTLFLDGRPRFAGMYWISTPLADKWESADAVRRAGEAGIHTYAFDVGSGVEWVGPGPGRSGHYDFSTVEARFGRIVDADPQARFHLRCQLEIGADDWWAKLYPKELEVGSNGRPYTQSFASRLWREQAKDFLRAYLAHLGRAGLADRIVAVQVGAGHTGEWVKGETAMYSLTSDYSDPMRVHFRDWLRGRYQNDTARLRAAWNAPNATFDTAEAPGAAEQLQTKGYSFRDPRREQKVIDYYRCL